MLTFLYKLLMACNRCLNAINLRLKEKIDHKRLCKELWKARKDLTIVEGKKGKIIATNQEEIPDMILKSIQSEETKIEETPMEPPKESEIAKDIQIKKNLNGFVVKELKFPENLTKEQMEAILAIKNARIKIPEVQKEPEPLNKEEKEKVEIEEKSDSAMLSEIETASNVVDSNENFRKRQNRMHGRRF